MAGWRWGDEPKVRSSGGWKRVFVCAVCGIRPAGLHQRVPYATYVCDGECLTRYGELGKNVRPRGYRGRVNGRERPDWLVDYPTAGYRPDLGHYVRSRWEANLARWLLWKGKEYCYEPEVIQVAGEGYCPDFWIYEWRLWLEAKGLWSGRARRKVKMFLFERSMERLVIVDRALYGELGKEYKKAFREGRVQGLLGWED